jgi:hypothetical protein
MFTRELQQKLYRFDCPSANTLRDYFMGYLPREQTREVDEHIGECPSCRTELDDLTTWLEPQGMDLRQDQVASHSFLNRMRVFIAQLVAPDRGVQALPALRGEAHEVLLFDVEEAAITLQIEQASPQYLTVAGQILIAESAAVSHGAVQITRVGGPLESRSTELDRTGGFVLTNIPPGIYQIIFQLIDRRLIIPNLTVEL